MGHGFCRVTDRCGLGGEGDSLHDGSGANLRRHRRSVPSHFAEVAAQGLCFNALRLHHPDSGEPGRPRLCFFKLFSIIISMLFSSKSCRLIRSLCCLLFFRMLKIPNATVHSIPKYIHSSSAFFKDNIYHSVAYLTTAREFIIRKRSNGKRTHLKLISTRPQKGRTAGRFKALPAVRNFKSTALLAFKFSAQ
eukprot:5364796-Pleurochrysis_carterae.AAC.3